MRANIVSMFYLLKTAGCWKLLEKKTGTGSVMEHMIQKQIAKNL